MHKKSKNATANRYSLTFFPKPRESYLIVKEKHLQKAWKIFRATEKKKEEAKTKKKKQKRSSCELLQSQKDSPHMQLSPDDLKEN